MTSSVEMTPSFNFYSLLPYEIRLAIIEEFVKGSCPRLAEYATVDGEWQSVVEKRTFCSLELCVDDTDRLEVFDDLEQICVGDRINTVSEIRLKIVLNNLGTWHTGSSTGESNVSTDEISREDLDEALCIHAERVATAALKHLFQVLEVWSRKRKPLSLTYKLLCQGPKNGHLFIGEQLQIDPSSFPEVTCIGSLKVPEFEWGVDPESTFQLLAKLPNAKEANITCACDDDLGSPDVLQAWRSCPNFQGSKLKVLSLQSTEMWATFSDFRGRTHPSLGVSQSIFAMTSRLEELNLYNVVDVPHFLRAASRASGNTSGPGWPNMRILSVTGSSGISPSDNADFNTELCDAVTKALPHMPNITRFEVTITSSSPDIDETGRSYCLNAYVLITASREDDRSVVGVGELDLYGIRPNEKVEKEWQRIARSQWRCKLEGVPKKDDSENVQGQPAD